MNRRDLLALLVACTSTCLPRWAWSQVKLPSNPFTLGIASGSPRHDSVVLWTRLHSAGLLGHSLIPTTPITVHWEVAQDEAFIKTVQSGTANALPELGHAVHVELQNLAPDRWYFYRFKVGDYTSSTGRTRTFPAPDVMASQLRFAYASCQRWEAGYFCAYAHMLNEQLDAVVFLGDYIYEYNSRGKNAVRTLPDYLPAFADTVESYRMRYAAYKSDVQLQAAHAHCPWIMTWDDHEVYNDYAKDQGEDLAPNFMQRKAAAYQAYYEHMPLRASTLIAGFDSLKTNGELRIYGQFNAGKLANFMVLDDRQYRDRQACQKPGRGGGSVVRAEECAELFDPQRTLLGMAQERWLDQSLGSTHAQWNIIAQQTLVGRRNYSPSDKADKALLQNDNWDGYPAARDRMLRSIHKHTPSNPVFVGGDIHQNWVGHVKADYTNPSSKALATEFCGTSLTSGGGENDDKFKDRLANNPHFVFADAEKRGYGVVELTPKRLTTTLRGLDDVRLQGSKVSTLAQFVVDSGIVQIQRGGVAQLLRPTITGLCTGVIGGCP
jgi:alkaline phosphatase D